MIRGLFPAPLIRELTSSLSAAATDESAVPSYTHWNPAIRWLMFRRLEWIRHMVLDDLSKFSGQGGRSVLDFGCGIGMMIPALAGSVGTLYACDEQLAPARATAERFEVTNVVFVPPAEIESRIPESSVDVAIAADVLEHVDDLPSVVDVIVRKLRPFGALIVSGPTENWAYRLGRGIAGFSGDYHVRSVYDVETILRESPLECERLRALPLPVPPTLFRITLWRRGD